VTGAARPRRPGEDAGPDSGESRAGRIRRAVRALRSRWDDERELADAIHGTVVGAAIMVAASLHGTLGQVVIAVVAGLLVYWVAERYAELLAAGVHGRFHSWSRIGMVLRRGWPMLQSAYAPVIPLLVASALGAELPTAVLTALGLSTVLLAGIGYEAARRSGGSPSAALAWAAGSALLGVAVIALKLSLH
jgi:hypothetical protein